MFSESGSYYVRSNNIAPISIQLEVAGEHMSLPGHMMLAAIAPEIVKNLERLAQWVHLLVASPTLFGFHDAETFTQRLMWCVGELSFHANGDVWDDTCQQSFLDPFAASHGIILEITTVGDQPGRMSQDSGALACGATASYHTPAMPAIRPDPPLSGVAPSLESPSRAISGARSSR